MIQLLNLNFNFNSIPLQITVIPSSKYCGLSVYTTSYIENELRRSCKKCFCIGKPDQEGGMKHRDSADDEFMKKILSKIRIFEEKEKTTQILGGSGYLKLEFGNLTKKNLNYSNIY